MMHYAKTELFAAALPVWWWRYFQGRNNKRHSYMDSACSNDASLDVRLAYNMANALQLAGSFNPGLTTYPEAPTSVGYKLYSDPLIMEWLFRQKNRTTK
ncbi:MAG: hypothetical protein R2771_05475 [Saprospiraceae bacterium]